MAESESNTVYVITGVNRGIGLCMVQKLLTRPQTVIVGTVRSEDSRAQLLAGTADVVPGAGSKLISVLVDYSAGLDTEDLERVFAPTLAEHGVKHVDVLIANAGHTMAMGTVTGTTAAQMRELHEINTIGPLITLQALWHLMTQGRRRRTCW
ncbi:hypothetical protein PWT90_01901 [Aphanocladium album]|nr:hypothetical protein PWT90_01901 [Aphanocladium album]